MCKLLRQSASKQTERATKTKTVAEAAAATQLLVEMLIDRDTYPSMGCTDTHTNMCVCVYCIAVATWRALPNKVSASRYTTQRSLVLSLPLSHTHAIITCTHTRSQRARARALTLSHALWPLSLPFYIKCVANCKQTFSRQFNSQHVARQTQKYYKYTRKNNYLQIR